MSRLADQARGCEHDSGDECGSAAIKQDFIKNVGHHDSLHSRRSWSLSCQPMPSQDSAIGRPYVLIGVWQADHS